SVPSFWSTCETQSFLFNLVLQPMKGDEPRMATGYRSSAPSSANRSSFNKPSSSFYVFQPRPAVPSNFQNAGEFDGKRLRKAVARKTVDYNSSVVKMLQARLWQRDYRDSRAIQPDIGYYTQVFE